jgi:hypothetical protein
MHEEEIHSQIAVIDRLVGRSVEISLKQMIGYHQHGSHSAQSVKDLITRF